LEICNYANNNSKHAEDAYRVEIHSTKPGPKVMISTCRDGYKHVVDSTLLDTLNTIWRSVSEGTGAILCRTNAEVDTVCNYFAELGVDFSRDRANDEAIHTLRSAIDPKYALDWLLTYLTAEKYSEYVRMLTIDGSADDPRDELLEFIKRYSKSKNISDRWARISAVNEILFTNKPVETKWEDILSTLLDNVSSEMVCPVMADDASAEMIVSAMIGSLEEEQAHNLYIGTIHSSKGLEYDTVMLVNVGGYRFKVDSEENQNLLYVGITRAKTNLFISYCERN
jgi:superfamily I DNA/RNA helicase